MAAKNYNKSSNKNSKALPTQKEDTQKQQLSAKAPVKTSASTASLVINNEINQKVSNLQNEIGDKIKLKYEIRSGETVLEKDDFLLVDKNSDNKSINKSNLPNSILNLFLENSNNDV